MTPSENRGSAANGGPAKRADHGREIGAMASYLCDIPASSPSYLVRKIAAAEIRRAATRYFGGSMLEIGCGDKNKGLLVGDLVDRHVGLDVPTTIHGRSSVDVFGNAYELPIRNDSFDSVLSTAVLEHLEEPGRALEEAFRILRPGGHALYTMPLFWHLHEEPRDFFRYTRYGLRYLFEKAGFEIVELRALSGFWTTFSTETCYYMQRFAFVPLLRPLVRALTWIFHRTLPRLDQIGPLRDERFTWMYLALVRKPDPSSPAGES